MCKIDGSMDKHLYIEILEDHLQKSVEFYGKDLDAWCFNVITIRSTRLSQFKLG